MKNLFIINEEEKKRILNLHESASKRHYLSEQEYKSTIDGIQMVVDKDGKHQRLFNLDTDENLVDWASRFSGQGSKPIQPKKATDPIPPKQTPCPVGKTTPEIEAFQRWVESKNKGWVAKHPQGIADHPEKGFGKCGPNTRREWGLSGETYTKELKSSETVRSIDVKTIEDKKVEPELKLKTANDTTAEKTATLATTEKDKVADTGTNTEDEPIDTKTGY